MLFQPFQVSQCCTTMMWRSASSKSLGAASLTVIAGTNLALYLSLSSSSKNWLIGLNPGGHSGVPASVRPSSVLDVSRRSPARPGSVSAQSRHSALLPRCRQPTAESRRSDSNTAGADLCLRRLGMVSMSNQTGFQLSQTHLVPAGRGIMRGVH